MRIDQELVRRKLCESRQEAQECIERGYVLLEGAVVTKKTKVVSEDSLIVVTKNRNFVSRGGNKLEGVLLEVYKNKEDIQNKLVSKTAIDVGSSTGGFTDCLLSYGITRVTAIDVGTAQLHTKLRKNNKVVLFENTDIRNFKTEELFDVIVVDLSFISLIKVVDTILSFGKSNSEYFLLIKPQFEVGFGNTKKGIVKDSALTEVILNNYKNLFTEKNLKEVKIFHCSIVGGDGNQEYFLYGKL